MLSWFQHSNAVVCAQRQLAELLAAACHSYARAASCRLHSVPVASQHLRVLEFKLQEQRAVIAFVAHDDAEGVVVAVGEGLGRCMAFL